MIADTLQNSQSCLENECALKLHRTSTFGEVSNTKGPRQKPAKREVSAIGTGLAVRYPTDGGAAFSAIGTGRGGARNSANRESYSLTAAQVCNLTAAAQQAEAIGLPFTRMISIHWQAAGVSLRDMVNATGRFADLLTKALARHDSRTAWLWVHENALGNGQDKGGHCHLLAHVPADLVSVITRLQMGWLRRITRQQYRARVIHSKPIGGRLGLEVGNPSLHSANLRVALDYVLKGANPAIAPQFGLERLKPGGLVIGKRCGTSQNIARKARAVWLEYVFKSPYKHGALA